MTGSTLPALELLGEEDGRHAALESELAPRVEPLGAPAAWPIKRVCSREFRARHDSGARRISAIELLVVHCTQGSTARGAAGWFANPDSRGSTHLVVDGRECYRTLPPSRIPWGAAGVNGRGWHIEFAGFAQWSRHQWLEHERMIRRGAWKLAQHSAAFKIPLRLLGPSGLSSGVKGVITHKTASDVFGGSHWDPGPGFPMDLLLGHARRYRKELE